MLNNLALHLSFFIGYLKVSLLPLISQLILLKLLLLSYVPQEYQVRINFVKGSLLNHFNIFLFQIAIFQSHQ